jgi:hypothetical protein
MELESDILERLAIFKKSIAITIALMIMILFVLEAVSSISFYQKNRAVSQSVFSTVASLHWLISRFEEQPISPKFERVMSLRKEGIDALPWYIFEPQLHHPDDPYFLANVPNTHIVFCNEAGAFAEWKTDEVGFRNPKGQIGSNVDYLFIGDSFTEGACESEENTIAGVFRRNRKSVFNLGRGGAGPLFNLATLVEYGESVNAKVVVWFFFTGNDLQNLREEKTTKLSSYLKDGYSQKLFSKRYAVGWSLKEFLTNEIEFNKDRIRQAKAIPHNSGYGESLDGLEALHKERFLLTEVLSRANSIVKTRDAKLMFVVLNHPSPNYDFEIQDIMEESVVRFAENNDIPYLNYTREYLKKNKSQLYTQSGPHFSADGYDSIGSEVFDWLQSDKTASKRVAD